MAARGVAAVVIPSGDPHQSEYGADHFQARQWLTGFTGSAGTAVVTQTRAILWTDFRYWIQAGDQIKGSAFELFKQGEDSVPFFDRWLADRLSQGDVIALDGRMTAAAEVKKYKDLFKEKGMVLDTEADLISGLWTDRPPLPLSPAWVLSETYAGKTRSQKLDQIREAMAKAGADTLLMTSLEDIAWTFNLRGQDTPFNPVNLAFALVDLKQAILFINPAKVDSTLGSQLGQDRVELYSYESITESLATLGQEVRILLDPAGVSYALYRAVNPRARIIEKINPAVELKAVKNATEIGHIRDTAVKDGIAVVKFLYWLENQINVSQITELSAAQVLYGFRKEQPDFFSNSFDPIMAFQDHSAMCHYKATSQTNVALEPRAMFLTDSGGNYLTGTTDITRTLHLGIPGTQEIRDYTLVLKGHIAVATALFPKGTKGFQIDTLARQFLWKEGMNFGHGTGHGVGFFLCVHEGPARISPHPVDVALKKGMLLTNEPGLYREKRYGIRLENMILVAEAPETEFGEFSKFENMTLCHFEKGLMDRDLLTDFEIEWINTYHQQVYEKISPGLDSRVKAWLKRKTDPL